MKKKQIAITLGVMCFVLTIAISIQLKTVRNSNTTISQSLTENALRDEVLRWKERYDNSYKELAESEKRLAEVRKQATQNDTTSNAKQEQMTENNMLLGTVEVTGPGIEIVMKDNNAVAETVIDPNLVLIHYQDILQVVNLLNNAGAEAISVNGQRIISTSALSCEGVVIKVNGQKIGTPIVIKAIGSQGLLYGSSEMAGGYISLMRDNGALVEVTQKDNLTVEKYNGIISYKYVQNAK